MVKQVGKTDRQTDRKGEKEGGSNILLDDIPLVEPIHLSSKQTV